EGKSTPINIRITGNKQDLVFKVGEQIRNECSRVPGVVDARVLQRMDAPAFVITVDRAKAADLGLTQADIMQNVIASTNSSISFNKKNFWIDPVSHNQYFVGVQYPEQAIESMPDILNIPITGDHQHRQVRLGDLASIERATIPSEIKHINIQPTIDVTMGVEVRDLGHVSDDLVALLAKFGDAQGDGVWATYDPTKPSETLQGSKIVLSGEYARMRDTFKNLALGLILATLLMYFLMTALFKSFVTPLVILSAVPVGGIGVVLMLYVTQTPINVQSLLGVIFMVGIVVSNTVLLTDFAQHLRMQEGLSPTEAIRKAASIRVRPVVMTALAAFFALVPMAMAFERGSEANAPLGRAVIGGLLAALVTTLFLVPALYSLVVRGSVPQADEAHAA
ncbi:MAG TPA: efflux RND transporter permease subunit, partial [Pirellulales bacterium]|nr:efflux RND transporter permease subunit [Pirellulales bacterium]